MKLNPISVFLPLVAVAALSVLTPSKALAQDGQQALQVGVQCASGLSFDGIHQFESGYCTNQNGDVVRENSVIRNDASETIFESIKDSTTNQFTSTLSNGRVIKVDWLANSIAIFDPSAGNKFYINGLEVDESTYQQSVK
ncbi:MAG: hypothetical protein ACRCXZ_01800 [Patescibacteria group bacterium]